MKYLSGSTNNRIEPTLVELGVGLVAQPGNGYACRLSRYSAWAGDNGCYAAKGNFDEGRWWCWLNDLPRDGCLFACSPDVLHWENGECFGDAEATLALAERWLPAIRASGFPAALVLQDGVEHLALPWVEFDAVFVGGSTAFKLAEPTLALVAEARRRGKWTHLGRCNTRGRIRAAAASSVFCSADGNKLGFGDRRNLPELTRWLAEISHQPSLWAAA